MNKISSIPAKSRTKSNPDGGCLQTAYQPADCTGYLKVYQQGSVVGILHWGHTSGCRRSMRWGHLGSVLNTRDLNEKFCVWRNQSYSRRKAAFIGKKALSQTAAGGRRSPCHRQGGGSQLIRVCPGFPSAWLSQGSFAVRESDEWYDRVKIPLFTSLLSAHPLYFLIFSKVHNKSCCEILFRLSPSDELIVIPIKFSMQDSQVACVSHCLIPFKNRYITFKSFPFPDEAVSLISKSLI